MNYAGWYDLMGEREVRQYYSGMKHFYGVYDAIGRRTPMLLDSESEFINWQRKARKDLGQILGLEMFEKCAPMPEFVSEWDAEDVVFTRIVISTFDHVRVPLTILKSKHTPKSGKSPVWLHSFGHGQKGKMVDNFNKSPQTSSLFPMKDSQVIGPYGLVQLAQRGYLCVAFDSFGSGERYDVPVVGNEFSNIGADNPNNNILVALGTCLLGVQVWELMRVLDYVLSLPECDGRAGVMGTSGGGHQSLFFAAMDERVLATVTSVWFYGFKESLIGLPHNCSCNYVPGLFERFDCQDIGALIVPRALHIDAGMRDYLNGRKTGLGNMLIPYYETRKAYELLHEENKISFNIFDGGHGCNTWNCADKHMKKSGDGLMDFAANALPLCD